jgi:hypothetical protein
MKINNISTWIFKQPESLQLWKIILWWELRRIPYNGALREKKKGLDIT